MMHLSSTSQIPDKALRRMDFDLFFGASGYEKRATHALAFLDLSKIPHKYAFAFEDRRTHQRRINDSFFHTHGVSLIEIAGDADRAVTSAVIEWINSIKAESVRIFVDYSSMTRCWYAAIISAIREIRTKRDIDCFFSYSPSVYEPPQATTPNQAVSPIAGFGGLDAIDRPSALVVGLGYEKDRAIGLLEYIDPAACFAFITDPPLDARYLAAISENNASFLKLIANEHRYRHPLVDLQRTGALLLSLFWGLKDQYRVILAPLGVKPFSLLCLLLAVNYPELDVWRVSSGTKAGTLIRDALGPLLVLHAKFASNYS